MLSKCAYGRKRILWAIVWRGIFERLMMFALALQISSIVEVFLGI
jgi:hypothetical protein